jgi:hypothetical protein
MVAWTVSLSGEPTLLCVTVNHRTQPWQQNFTEKHGNISTIGLKLHKNAFANRWLWSSRRIEACQDTVCLPVLRRFHGSQTENKYELHKGIELFRNKWQFFIRCGTVLKIGICRLGVWIPRLSCCASLTNSFYAARKPVMLQCVPSQRRRFFIFRGHPAVIHK